MFEQSDQNQARPNYSEKGKNPFIAGRKEWDDRLHQIAATSHAWKGFAFFLALLVGVLVFGITHIGSQSKIKPYMSVVDRTNYVVHVMGPAEEAATLNDKLLKSIVQNEVRTFIENIRTIVADNHAQKKIMTNVYSRLAAHSAAAKFANEFYSVRSPFKYAENGTISAEIYSALPLSEKSWQVEWKETSRNLAGDILKISRYRGIITYELVTPESEADARKNALGFYITNLTWSVQD
ncbi:type IV secretion system protein [Methylovorus glucosotrophus]|uniref:Conjugal transfer protein n=1 Tax=Methylovorus glucosotrophus (strain SIP3-4) TaxID=582744 RepID=C6XER9_METGS|nr:type IV secretion system protein [Methylovorus glucosotrophus]ACT52126.1 Conjugal transfer protein [Methylovorus glucosotrophus SIP3-4]